MEAETEKKRTISHGTVMNIMGFMIVGLLIIAVAFSPIFVLRDIKITGNQFVTDEEICRIASISSGENLFQLQTDEIKETLLKDLRIEQVIVKRSFPSGLNIEISERVPVAIVACDYGYLDIGKDGVVLDAHRTLKDMPVPLVTGIELADLFVGDKISDDKLFLALQYLDLLDDFSRQQLSEISIGDAERVMAYTTNSVQIRIGKLERLDEKAEITKSFVNELQTAKYPIEYIDLQYTSPFIKFREL